MAKRLTDTNKYRKPFIRGLQGPYKLLWDYLYLDCDHAGIWIVDFKIAQIYIGEDMPVNKEDALKYFNLEKIRIIEIDNNKKWFIPSFVEFQYGELNESNRVHNSVIQLLKKNGIYKNKDHIKGLISPSKGLKDKEKDKAKDINININKKTKKININQEIKIIIDYLNLKCKKYNKKFTYKNKSFNSHINARLSDNFTIDNFKKVIDNKLKDKNFQDNPGWYNPDTLFSPGHFEKYLNEYHKKTESEIQAEREAEDQRLEANLIAAFKKEKEDNSIF